MLKNHMDMILRLSLDGTLIGSPERHGNEGIEPIPRHKTKAPEREYDDADPTSTNGSGERQ